ncbi:MAG: winged helix-turn-helix transcriptional regulator [Candidatus Bathyarchaeia archaeon]|jgi:DNA-binding transcriptional ArsR family regulator
MSRVLTGLFAFSVMLLAIAPAGANTSSRNVHNMLDNSSSDFQTKVLVDTAGNVHVLWVVPALNGSNTHPGIWYSKYSPNGTNSIPPTMITNSTSAQSADLAVDSQGDAGIVWAEDIGTSPRISSALYLLRFNSTVARTAQILTSKGSLIMWPSVALDNNGTSHLVWTRYDPNTEHALVNFESVSGNETSAIQSIASYNETRPFPPKARVALDPSSGNLHIAWGESQSADKPVSTVDYARLATNGTVITMLQVAKFDDTINDVAVTATAAQDGAFVIWQTATIGRPVYVSQISSAGRLVYLKELNYPSAQAAYLAVSNDSQDNLYVVWYQLGTSGLPSSQKLTPVTNVTYLQMNRAGNVVQTGNEVVRGPILAVTVTTDGDLYAISPTGFVKIVTPNHQTGLEWLVAVALIACFAFVGTFSSEASRYKLFSSCARIPWVAEEKPSTAQQEIIHLLSQKPGLKLREIKRLANRNRIGTLAVIRMERRGAIASFRDGFARRFYVKETADGSMDTVSTRIILWIIEHPGIWEAQLSKDLGLSQQLVNYHLKKLRASKLITASLDSNGTRKLYRFAENG